MVRCQELLFRSILLRFVLFRALFRAFVIPVFAFVGVPVVGEARQTAKSAPFGILDEIFSALRSLAT